MLSTTGNPPAIDSVVDSPDLEGELVMATSSTIRNPHAEFHIQPQMGDSFEDGVLLILWGWTDEDASSEHFISFSVPTGLAVRGAFDSSHSDLWNADDDVRSECGHPNVSHGLPDSIDQRAQQRAEDSSSFTATWSATSSCEIVSWYIWLSDVADVFWADDFRLSVRIPSIYYYSRFTDQTEDLPLITTSEGIGDTATSNCRRATYALLETYRIKMVDALGAVPASAPVTMRRTASTYWGGTDERPVAWVASERPPDSGTVADCVTQGVALDGERPAGAEKRNTRQIYGGLLLGGALGFITSALAEFVSWRTRRME